MRTNLKNQKPTRIRVLAAADLHQSKQRYQDLVVATEECRPDVVAIVGDALGTRDPSSKDQYGTAECAKILAGLSVEHLVFVRGDHEDSNWTDFVAAWPHEHRKLRAIYGTAYRIGPLVIVGFPCSTGSEFDWCSCLPADSDEMRLDALPSREPLTFDTEVWLPGLMDRLGPAGRILWLMHEGPMEYSVCEERKWDLGWADAVERFAPRFVVCAPDRNGPVLAGAWKNILSETIFVKVGQGETAFQFSIFDFEFPGPNASLPSMVILRAFPSAEDIII
jgi:hypothetical protein